MQNFVIAKQRSQEAGSLPPWTAPHCGLQMTSSSLIPRPDSLIHGANPVCPQKPRNPAELQQQPLRPGAPRRARQPAGGLLPRLEPRLRAAPRTGPRLCPARIQLQVAPAAATHLCEACWPRGRSSGVGLRHAPSGVRIQILGRWLPLIRARGGGGKPGTRWCPAARPRRGMVSPSPAQRAPAPTRTRRAARRPRALAEPRDERLCSANPVASVCSSEHFAGGFEGGCRPPTHLPGRSPLLSTPSGCCCTRALARSAGLRGERPARVCRTERSAERGASLPPPAGFPHLPSSRPPSFPPSLASSLLLAPVPAPAHGAPPIQNL